MKKISIKKTKITPEIRKTMEEAKMRNEAFSASMEARISPVEKKLVEFSVGISKTIDRILTEKGRLSQKELAQKSGLTEAALSHLLRTVQNPTLLTLAKISVALGEDIILTPEMAQEKAVLYTDRLENNDPTSTKFESEFSFENSTTFYEKDKNSAPAKVA
jgi:transcriptional regulator with XRE-family HTH domain